MVIISEDVNLDKFPIPKAMIEVEPEESWDTVERPSYDPAKYCESNLILQQTKVAGAAKRRQNRFEQRQKFQSLQAVSSDTVKQPKETVGVNYYLI